MDNLSDTNDKIVQEHSLLIHLVVDAIREPQHRERLDSILAQADENGWTSLAQAIRLILAGERNLAGFGTLDDEDHCIVVAILRSVDDRTALPDLAAGIDSKKTAIRIATLLLAVRWGNAEAAQTLSDMAAQMMNATGDIAQIGSILGYLLNGERCLEKLTDNMGPIGTGIVHDILMELQKREVS
ncbi:MAG: hypothetical protein ACYC7I_05865 [Gammaproteobacteria bacterium]